MKYFVSIFLFSKSTSYYVIRHFYILYGKRNRRNGVFDKESGFLNFVLNFHLNRLLYKNSFVSNLLLVYRINNSTG